MQKNRLMATAALTATLGFGLVYTFHNQASSGHHGDHAPAAVPESPTHGTTDHGHSDHNHGDHGHHGTLAIPADQPLPTVTLVAHPDSVSGWNLEIQTEHWGFAPERVNQSSLTTEGHAHLYVNGEKVTRLYSTWTYLPSLPSGEHTLTVSLNANGHEELTHDGAPIESRVVVAVP